MWEKIMYNHTWKSDLGALFVLLMHKDTIRQKEYHILQQGLQDEQSSNTKVSQFY